VRQDPGGSDAASTLEEALEQLEWWDSLAHIVRRRKRSRAELRVTIAADMSFYEANSPTGVDPALVEHLVDLFHGHGFTNVCVAGAVAEESQWYENREPFALADLVGYKYVTPAGVAYAVESFSDNLGRAAFPKTSVLSGSPLSKTWTAADVRINFAKNKTHEAYYYALALYNMLGILPARDRRLHYSLRLTPSDVAGDLLAAFPPHLNIIDALVSSQGTGLLAKPIPVQTSAIIAGTSTLLVDWIAALKMRADPFASVLNGPVLRRFGLPSNYTVSGDLEPYSGWQNVDPITAELSRYARSTWSIGAILPALTSRVDTTLFPHKNVYADRANATLAKSSQWVFGVFAAAAYTSRALEVWRTLFRKGRLRRVDASVNLDLSAFPLSEYSNVDGYFSRYERLIAEPALLQDEIRIRQVDGANLFAAQRHLDLPFDEFVERVDVANAIAMMNDYIGGRTAVVARDGRGRATHQAERNIYIPQPNYLVLYGGEPIDVTKLELIRRTKNQHRIVWRTVKSENRSADVDDGSVTFARDGSGTLVRVAGLQKFRLPAAVDAARFDLSPGVMEILTSAAYRTYVEGTIANLEAAYAGEDSRIGENLDESCGEDGQSGADAVLTSTAERLGAIAQKFLAAAGAYEYSSASDAQVMDRATADADGFYHFEPARDSRR